MRRLQSVILLIISSSPLFADWKADVGWNNLEEWASPNINNINLPTTETTFAGMVEAEQGPDNLSIYSPDPGDAQFKDGYGVSDVTINDVYGENHYDQTNPETYSGHATGIARLFFGNSSSLSPDIALVNVYGSNRFLAKLLSYGTSWSEEVMSHAYIGSFTDTKDEQTQEVTETKQAKSEKYCRAFDWSSSVANILHISGANNGTSTNLPHIWSHGYNNITVGRTDGVHSAGTVQSGYHGPGRQKPELVTPQGTTSSATGATASIASFLRAKAETHSSANAALPLTLKSILLAGADKTKFADWDNTLRRPIDEVYGAGETNIFNSFRILHAAEATANSSVGLYGWDYSTVSDSSTNVYTFTVPSYATNASISANLSWNRTVFRGRVKGSLVIQYDDLADLSLTLKDSGGNDVFISNSLVDNLEHIWQTKLTPGNYSLTVNSSSAVNSDYALAWRVDVETNNSPDSFTHGASSNYISFVGLIPSHPYFFQYSSNLTSWNDIAPLTSSATGTLSASHANASLGEKVFYRLRYYTP